MPPATPRVAPYGSPVPSHSHPRPSFDLRGRVVRAVHSESYHFVQLVAPQSGEVRKRLALNGWFILDDPAREAELVEAGRSRYRRLMREHEPDDFVLRAAVRRA